MLCCPTFNLFNPLLELGPRVEVEDSIVDVMFSYAADLHRLER